METDRKYMGNKKEQGYILESNWNPHIDSVVRNAFGALPQKVLKAYYASHGVDVDHA